MRLRITVLRNGLPETPIVWGIDTTFSPTIFQLLEQVNEIIPIESDGEWGLEDYVVELKGQDGLNYECLHFQLVTKVLRDDDEIMSNGKRIFDGVPWGRQFLQKTIGRPTINILPKKPKRILFTEIDLVNEDNESYRGLSDNVCHDSEKESTLQLQLLNNNDDGDSENDYDYVPEEEEEKEEEEYNTEAEAIDDITILEDDQINVEISTSKFSKVADTSGQEHEISEIQSDPVVLTDPIGLSKIHKLHSEFPTSTLAVCKHVLDGTHGDMKEAQKALSLGFTAIISPDFKDKISRKKSYRASPKTKYSGRMVSNSDSSKVAPKCTDTRSVKFDHDGLPTGYVEPKKKLSFITEETKNINILPDSSRLELVHSGSVKNFPNNGSGFSHKFAEKETPKSHESGTKSTARNDIRQRDNRIFSNGVALSVANGISNMSSKTHLNAMNQLTDTNDKDSSESDSDSSSCSSSSIEAPEQSSSRNKIEIKVPVKVNEPNYKVTRPPVAPGNGKRATQRRNRRRRISNEANRLREKGILPAGYLNYEPDISAEKQKSNSLEAEQKEVSAKKCSVNVESETKSNASEEFRRRQKELLNSLASGGIEVDLNSSRCKPSNSTISEKNGVVKGSTDSVAENIYPLSSHDKSNPVSTTPDPCNANSSQRSKSNRAARKRMLLSAMGIKSPNPREGIKITTTQAKEQKVLQSPPRDVESESNMGQVTEGNSGNWRDKIIYRAVECLQEGIELSEPPFPFIQRWDPQQQVGKRKRSQHYQVKQFFDSNHSYKKQKQRDAMDSYPKEQGFTETNESSVHEIRQDSECRYTLSSPVILGQNCEDKLDKPALNAYQNNAESQEDLASIPDNTSSLPDLSESEVRASMVIIFKQLEVSAASRWQPQVSAYKTAIINSVENGHIQITLARRDTPVSEKLFNEQGKRIYSGFDEIDDGEIDDDGRRSFSFNELIEPKVLEQSNTVNDPLELKPGPGIEESGISIRENPCLSEFLVS